LRIKKILSYRKIHFNYRNIQSDIPISRIEPNVPQQQISVQTLISEDVKSFLRDQEKFLELKTCGKSGSHQDLLELIEKNI
jgi:hypothetical protein